VSASEVFGDSRVSVLVTGPIVPPSG